MAVDTQLYDLLGVKPNASEGDIKKAYRKKAKEHHPDKNINDPQAAEKFQEMAAAYEILSDPQSREIYDESGMDGLTGAKAGPGMEDFLFSFGFDLGGQGFGKRRNKGDASIIPYEVTLEDLYNGKSVKMNLERDVICSTCNGSGAKGSAKAKTCSSCQGQGWQFTQRSIGGGMYTNARINCTTCQGAGEIIREKDRCKKCKGQKIVKETNRHEITIEKGMSDGQRIVLAGAGDQEPGIPPGDVVFVLHATKHDSFERSGNDLLTHIKVTLSEALLGFSRIIITHLDGRGIKVTVPPGKIINSDDSIIIRGEGMPIQKLDTRGDLYVIFSVEMPNSEWFKTLDTKALESLLPPKKPDLDPLPEIVDEPTFEETDMDEVRAQSFPAGHDFFDRGYANQFGDNEADWEDESDLEDFAEPECRNQ